MLARGDGVSRGMNAKKQRACARDASFHHIHKLQPCARARARKKAILFSPQLFVAQVFQAKVRLHSRIIRYTDFSVGGQRERARHKLRARRLSPFDNPR